MLNQQLSAKVSELWNLFRSAGSSNALSSLEQITYLIALKRLEAINQASDGKLVGKGKGVDKSSGTASYPRWSELIKLKSQMEKFTWVKTIGFPYLKNLNAFGNAFKLAMLDAAFGISHQKLLEDVVKLIDELPVGNGDIDAQGDIYEDLLAHVSFAGKHGQFLTPRHIVQTVVELCDPKPGETICDPAAGSAGFLVSAYQWIQQNHTPDSEESALNNKNFVGYDFDTTMVRLGLMNMMLHGISQPEYYYQDSLRGERLKPRQFDLIMSYPPFGGIVERRTLNKKLLTLKTSKTELLFAELSLALLKAKGRCAIIVPEGLAVNTDLQSRTLREQIINNHKLEAVVSLPRGCFLPYTASKTAILLVKNGDVTDKVLFFEVTSDGYTLDVKRRPDPENNDLAIVPRAYRALMLGDDKAWASKAEQNLALQRSILVTKKDITANGLSFSIEPYRKITAVAEDQEDPQLILKRIHAWQGQIEAKLKQIQTMIQEVSGA
jgi:type I restriction enzyme M protein